MTAVEHPLDPEELMAYRDGELPPARAAAVQSHLATCAACQTIDGDLSRVSRELATWTVDNPPATLRPKDASVDTAAAKPTRATWLPAWGIYSLSGAAAAVVLVVLASLPTRFSKSPSEGYEPPPLPRLSRTPAAVAAGSQDLKTVAGWSAEAPPKPESARQPAISTPRIVRTATLTVVAKDFDAARSSLNRILGELGGFVGSLDVTGVPPNARVLKATLRVPAARLDSALASLKNIGTVIGESQTSDDVTEQVLDLEARIANGRHTEKRLNDLLQKRTGDLSDVLAAEREIARVREEIERLDAQRQNLESRVSYAAITLRIEETEKSTVNLGPLPLSARFRNAFVDGFEAMFVSIVEVAIVALQTAPALLFWGVAILGPIYFVVRRRSISGIGRTGP